MLSTSTAPRPCHHRRRGVAFPAPAGQRAGLSPAKGAPNGVSRDCVFVCPRLVLDPTSGTDPRGHDLRPTRIRFVTDRGLPRVSARQRAGLVAGERQTMSQSEIAIVDWGKHNAPMVISLDGQTVVLEIHNGSGIGLDRLADCAGRCHGSGEVHLGFNGYLRVCDAICIERAGVSIMDLADAEWLEFYDARLPPHDAIDRELKENGYQV